MLFQIRKNEESFAEAFCGNPSMEGIEFPIESQLETENTPISRRIPMGRKASVTKKRRYLPVVQLQRQVLLDQRYNLRLERQKLLLELRKLKKCTSSKGTQSAMILTNTQGTQTDGMGECDVFADLSNRDYISYCYRPNY